MTFNHLWKAALGAATMLAAIVTIFSYFNKEDKHASVDIYTRSYTFNVPPHYSSLSEEVRDYKSYMTVYSDVENIIPEKLNHEDLIKVSKFFSDKLKHLWGSTYSNGLSEYKGYSYIRMYSSGELAAKKPVLDLPKSAVSFIRYSDKSTAEYIGEQRIKLKDLYYDDLVEVWSWYKSSLDEEDLSRIRLKHDTGISYSNTPQEIWGSKAKWYAENYNLIEPALLILGFFTLIFFSSFIVNVLYKEQEPDSQ